SLMSEVNRHLRAAWDLPASLPATRANERTFLEWRQRACRAAQQPSLEEVSVILAVHKSDAAGVSALQWGSLVGRGLYLQILHEAEGRRVWERGPVLVLVWSSRSGLRSGNQPLLLICRITTSQAGPRSELRGTNQAVAPVAGFVAVIFDENQLTALQQGHTASPARVQIWSGRDVEVYDFEF